MKWWERWMFVALFIEVFVLVMEKIGGSRWVAGS
jgi:hypothetical protein